MGFRLYVHKKHIIECGKSAFNWNNGEINTLLYDTCSCYFNDEGFYENATEVEVLKEDFKKLYRKILKGTNEQIKKRLLDEYNMSEDTIEDLERIGFAEIANIFREMYKDAQKKDDYIYFSWM